MNAARRYACRFALTLLLAIGSAPAVASSAAPAASPDDVAHLAAAPRAPAHAKQRVRTLSRNGRSREGFTLQLGLGAGYQTGEITGASLSEVALGGFDIGAGGFLNPWTGLLVRVTGTFSLPEDDFFDRVSVALVWGGSVQYFVADWLKLEAGLGVATHWVRTLERLEKSADVGLGFLLGLSVPFLQRGEHSLQLGLSYTPLLVRDAPFHSALVTFTWQLL